MPCYSPMQGYRSRTLNPSGKRSIVFNANQGYIDMPVEVPCGQCIGCRLEKSRQWAIRCLHEASLYSNNCFITLTYSPDHLPKDGSLDITHFQKFMKRLRKKYGENIRFFHCGEYGEKNSRPHYHALIFNFDFKDKTYWKSVNEHKYYVSEELTTLWGYGFTSIGDVTFESAAYCARYVTKKITGKDAMEHYNTIDYNTGEILQERRPEYVTMSRRPGIGKGWFEKYKTDVFPEDFVVIRGREMQAPKYYSNLFEAIHPSDYEFIQAKRRAKAKLNKQNSTHDRLKVREFIQKTKFARLKRGYENET